MEAVTVPGSGPNLEISPDGSQKLIELSDGEGLRNPTGIVGIKDQIVIVDGNQVISTSTDGTVTWRKSLDEDGVFFYDIEALDEATLLVSDFGRGVFVRVASDTGTIQPYLPEIQISGLARFELDGDKIFAASWGADGAWDSAIYRVSDLDETAVSEKLSDGFGNLESVEVIDGQVILGAYRGHGIAAELSRLRREIATLAADRIEKGSTVILGEGEATLLLAEEIRSRCHHHSETLSGLTVITNSLDVMFAGQSKHHRAGLIFQTYSWAVASCTFWNAAALEWRFRSTPISSSETRLMSGPGVTQSAKLAALNRRSV